MSSARILGLEGISRVLPVGIASLLGSGHIGRVGAREAGVIIHLAWEATRERIDLCSVDSRIREPCSLQGLEGHQGPLRPLFGTMQSSLCSEGHVKVHAFVMPIGKSPVG